MMSDVLHSHIVETERIGALNVYVQGDVEAARRSDKDGGKPAFLTVHDVGKNHNSWLNFTHHPSMSHVRERAVFIHVDLLGQEDDAEDLSQDRRFPTLQEMGEDLINVLDNLRIKMVIAMGDGAGANIMARFAAMHVTRCLGVVLVSPVAGESGLMERFQDRINSRVPRLIANNENMLVLHKFGHKMDEVEEDEELLKAFEQYRENLKSTKLNVKNAQHYVNALLHREDLGPKLKLIKDDVMLVSGSKSQYSHFADEMFVHLDKAKTSNLKIDDVGDVLEEAPSKLANSLLLFCKGLGWLTTLTSPGVERQRSVSQSSTGSGGGGRRMSMEEYDKPNIRRLSLTGAE